jgi:hypothetical protein
VITLEEIKEMKEDVFLDYCQRNGIEPSAIFNFLKTLIETWNVKWDKLNINSTPFIEVFKDTFFIRYMDWSTIQKHLLNQTLIRYPDYFPDNLLDDISVEDWKLVLMEKPYLFHKFKKTIYIEKMGAKILDHFPQIKLYL